MGKRALVFPLLKGLRGYGLFTVEQGKIRFQRGYWDKPCFLRLDGLPIE